jgi:hypothetical protein
LRIARQQVIILMNQVRLQIKVNIVQSDI